MAFGAYYGTNTTIEQGAAGFGQPPSGAYREGSLGAGGAVRQTGRPTQRPFRMPRIRPFGMPPAVHAYREGSLGYVGGAARRIPGRPGTGRGDPLQAYREGSLGYVGGAARRIPGRPGTGRGDPLQAFREGSLGAAIDECMKNPIVIGITVAAVGFAAWKFLGK